MGGTPTARLTVPQGSMVVLIGPAGSGKSTLAARLFPSAAVLSSDAFRARIGKGEADQSVTGAAFAALHRALDARLAARQTTIIDATSLAPGARSGVSGMEAVGQLRRGSIPGDAQNPPKSTSKEGT